MDEEMDRIIISTASDSETESDDESNMNDYDSGSDCCMSGIKPMGVKI